MSSDLLTVTILIAVGFLFVVAFYESMSTRDVVVARVRRLMGRLTRRRWILAVAYATTVLVVVPILVIAWAAVLDLALFLVASIDLIDNIAFIAVAIVGAARVLAYVREKTSHELAKAIPMAMLFLLLTGGALNLDAKLARLAERDGTELTGEMIAFLIALEITLRVVTDVSHAALSALRRRQGVESELGVWATAWAAIRRPMLSLRGRPPAVSE